MPSVEAHQKIAAKNQQMLDVLDQHLDAHPEWVVTVAFYQAVHVVESLFASGKPPFHSSSHETRLERLKQTRQYSFIFKHFRPLYAASLVARYLVGDGKTVNDFSDYLTSAEVKQTMINHHLKQLIQSAERLMTPAESGS